MTNTQTIEKLNDGLVQLIDAYEILQATNEDLEENIKDLTAKNADLEYKLSDFNSSNEVQTTKMDGMLNKIQTLLKPSSTETNANITVEDKNEEDEEINNDTNIVPQKDTASILDIKLDNPTDDIKDEFKQEATSKIDLGRMESLLNGL
jgi:hypothetical protein